MSAAGSLGNKQIFSCQTKVPGQVPDPSLLWVEYFGNRFFATSPVDTF